MKKGHGSSRRQAYGRRMKEVRTRRNDAPEVDLEGPAGWSRGASWDDDQSLSGASMSADYPGSSVRSR
jgi:hypothetical protein